METSTEQNENPIPLALTAKFAFATALGLIAYFLLMKFLNLVTVVELRFLNFFILFGGIAWLMKIYRNEQGGKIEYLSGLGMGFLASFITALLFALFIYTYLSYADTGLMENIKTQRFGNFLTPGKAAFVVAIEGIASGACISLGLMQYFRFIIKAPKLEV